MNVWGYPQPGKRKSEEILVSFCAGAGGYISTRPGVLNEGPAAFYGTVGLEPLFRLAQRTGDWYYIDNAYFDAVRGRYYRISRNALQRASSRPDYARLEQLGVQVKPWRKNGGHVLVVVQSGYYLGEICGWGDWLEEILARIRASTDRPIRIRPWLRDKGKAAATLAEDLAGAWAVVTHSSAAAIEALVAGVPVFCDGLSVAHELGDDGVSRIESPRMPDGREEWVARLAASQWRLDEMRAGVAWRSLQEQKEEVTQ